MKKITHENEVVGYVHDGTLVIDETAFNALSAQIRSAILVANPAKNYDFRKDLSEITNGRKVLERLKAGEDVSLELAFHEIKLPRNFEEISQKYRAAVEQIEQSLLAVMPVYPFAENKGESVLKLTGTQNQWVTNGNYKCSIFMAKRLWRLVARFWAGKVDLPPETRWETIGGHYRAVKFSENAVNIGCQTITRWQVEQLALELGWDFPSAA